MPRKPKLTLIDQRLAAAAHKRQVFTITKAEEAAAVIESIFAGTQKKLLDVITSNIPDSEKQQRFPEILKSDLEDVAFQLIGRFETIAGYAYGWMVRDYLDIIPSKWLAAKMPPQVRTMFESIGFKLPKVCLSFDHGSLSVGELAPLTEEGDQWTDEIAWFSPTMWATRLTLEETEKNIFGVPVDLIYQPEISDDDKRKIIAKVLFPRPSEEEVQQIIDRPMRVKQPDGTTRDAKWQDRLEALSHKITDKTAAFGELVRGYTAGENIAQIRKRLEPLVSGIKSSAQRIARTEGLRVAERIQRRSWDQLGDMMEGAQILAVLDQNTRPHHAARNGTIYYKDESKANGTTTKKLSEMPDLPDEPNCRCWSTPILTPPEELKTDPTLREALRTTSGAGVPDPASYDDWWRNATEPEKKIVVGVKRYNLVRDKVSEFRPPEFDDFVDPEGRLLDVEKLASESELDRQARKQRVRSEIERRKRLVEKISERGFEFPKVEPTKIPGITFSREVDPTSQVDLLGETIRGNILRLRRENEKKNGAPDLNEKQIRQIGRLARKYISSPDILDFEKRAGRLIKSKTKYETELLKAWVGEFGASSKKEKQKWIEKQSQIVTKLKGMASDLRELLEVGYKKKQQRLLELLQATRDMGTTRDFPTIGETNEEVHLLVSEGQKFFPADWLTKIHAHPIKFKRGKRGFFNGKTIQVGIDHVRHPTRSTAVHELWHAAEQHVDGVFRAEKELYQRRTKKSKVVEIEVSRLNRTMNPRSKPEYTRHGSWLGENKSYLSEYIGKFYDGDNFLEVGTMGMEGVVFNTVPIQNDPEVYDFVLGSLLSL